MTGTRSLAQARTLHSGLTMDSSLHLTAAPSIDVTEAFSVSLDQTGSALKSDLASTYALKHT